MYSLCCGATSALVLSFPKLDLQLEINGLHHGLLDQLMPFITWGGDGLFAILLSIILWLFVHQRAGVMLFTTYLVTALLAQAGKHMFFPDAMRPFYYLKENPAFHKIPEFLYFEYHSFPSGHTTTAFAMATTLSLVFRCRVWGQIGLLALACLVGFSRTYLSQHFLGDVVVGSLLGTLGSLGILYLWPTKWYPNETPWYKR